MLNRNYIYYISFVFLICSTLNYAQKGETIISGFAKDIVSGESLVGTNILLYKDTILVNEPPYRGAAANEYGFYAIPKIPRGNYFLIARNIAYKTLIRNIKVTSDSGVIRYNIEMTSTEIPLSEVVITGQKRSEVKASTIDIPPDLLKKFPSISGEVDIFKSLEYLPGVKTASEISTGLYIRGGSPDQNLTLVDGVILYNPTHLGNFASTFNSDAVQSLRLIKGAFPAEYGGRLSSVLDIKLRSGTKENNQGKIGLGTVSSNATFEGPLGTKASYLISGRKMYYDLIQKNFNKNSSVPNYNFYDINAKINYNISDNDIVIISGMFSKDNLYNPGATKDINYNIDWNNGAVSVDWLKINLKSLLINNSVSYVNYEFRTLLQDKASNSTGGDYFSYSRLQDLIFKSRMDMFWHEDHTLKVGAELSIHNYDLIYGGVYDPLLESDPNATATQTSNEASLFFQDEWNASSKFKTNIGGRFYYFKTNNYLKFEPRISASYELFENVSLKGAYSIAHQFLHLVTRNDISLPTDLWYPSTKEVLPSRSSQYVFGMESTISNQYTLSVEGYYKDMKNLYEFKNNPQYNFIDGSVKNLFTDGDGEAYGVEFFLNKFSGNFSGWIGYTLSWTKRQFDELNTGRIYYPRFDRRNDISVVLIYSFTNNLSVSATWTYATGQHISIASGQFGFSDIGLNNSTTLNYDYGLRNDFKLPDYHKLDLNITYKFIWGNLPFQAYLSVFNVYNRKNPFAVYTTTTQSSSSALGKPELKQITLFPFLPAAGISVGF